VQCVGNGSVCNGCAGWLCLLSLLLLMMNSRGEIGNDCQ
jgi:hypothetical protein